MLLGLLPFARFDGVLAVALACAGLAAHWMTGGRVRWRFVLPLGAALVLFVLYLATWLAPYAARPIVWMTLNRRPLTLLLVGAIAALGVGLRLRQSEPVAIAVRRWLPHATTAVIVALAAYAWFVRQPGGALAVHDAWSLRMFSWYVHPAAIAAALAGLAILSPRAFWRDPSFFTVACGTAIFVFHRIRIVPEHFWATRRYVAIILPAVLFGIATTLLLPLAGGRGSGRSGGSWRVATLLRLVVLALVAWRFATATSRIRGHVEYAGVIPRLEALAARFTSSDLLVVESRNASDVHVLALPLAYIYDRSVLVLNSPKPDKAAFAEFLTWARDRRRDVYFIGGGGTDLLSRDVAVTAVASERFQIPEYESLPQRLSDTRALQGVRFRHLQVRAADGGRRRGGHRRRRRGRPAGRAFPCEGARPARHLPLDARPVVPEPRGPARRRARAGAVDGQRRPAGHGAARSSSRRSSARSRSGGSSSGLACIPTRWRFHRRSQPRRPARPTPSPCA